MAHLSIYHGTNQELTSPIRWVRTPRKVARAALSSGKKDCHWGGIAMQDTVQLSRRVAGAQRWAAGLRKRWPDRAGALLVGLTVFGMSAGARAVDPSVVDPNLGVKTVVAGLNQPTSMAFLPTKDILVTDILVL